jgi:hypothetical protein
MKLPKKSFEYLGVVVAKIIAPASIFFRPWVQSPHLPTKLRRTFPTENDEEE